MEDVGEALVGNRNVSVPGVVLLRLIQPLLDAGPADDMIVWKLPADAFAALRIRGLEVSHLDFLRE